MEKNFVKKIFSVGITCVLIAAMALFGSACGKTEKAKENGQSGIVSPDVTEIGEGKTRFSLSVENEGKTKNFLVKTDKSTLGDALEEVGLIKGADGMVLSVEGVALDFEKDGKYWAFYQNGSYANKGAYETEIQSDVKYAFKAENG